MSDQAVLKALEQINRAWLDGRPDAMLPWIHPRIALALPGFTGRIHGAEAFLDGFKDFCKHARVDAFEASEHLVDIVESTAVASFRFEMIYEREGSRFRATGRDFWVFQLDQGKWLAVWRTMLETAEEQV